MKVVLLVRWRTYMFSH